LSAIAVITTDAEDTVNEVLANIRVPKIVKIYKGSNLEAQKTNRGYHIHSSLFLHGTITRGAWTAEVSVQRPGVCVSTPKRPLITGISLENSSDETVGLGWIALTNSLAEVV
jgi:hypothetical protein